MLTLLTEICAEQNVAMLLATHDPQAASFANDVHALRDGVLVQYEADEPASSPR